MAGKIDAVRIARCGVGEYFVQVGQLRLSAETTESRFMLRVSDLVEDADLEDFDWTAQDFNDDDPPPFSYARALSRARDLATTPDLGADVVFMGIVNLYLDKHEHAGGCVVTDPRVNLGYPVAPVEDCDYCTPGLVALTAKAIATLNEDAGQSFKVKRQQSTGARARNLANTRVGSSPHVVKGAQGGASDSMALVTIFLEPLGGCSPPWSYWDHPDFAMKLARLLPADLYVSIINPGVAYVCPV